LSCQWTVE